MAITVERSFRVDASRSAVAAYLEDFTHTQQWDPGTVACRRLDVGPIAVGARWENTSRFRGRETTLHYRLLIRRPERLVFRGENRTVQATDDIAILPNGPGSLITYRATLRFKRVFRLAEPLLRGAFDELADAVQARLPEVLETLPTSGR
ncbi:SRPBCC family protein [Streptacidiphilus anmyonensis]|uniref:SRPBCC family protein n=1 Tax=Streptacidiphilus anmyonensis TaxID=405782 RepID=UPI0005AB5A4C|nr:SRPBCC family protein [Streptacidiphilus anmyonensis]